MKAEFICTYFDTTSIEIGEYYWTLSSLERVYLSPALKVCSKIHWCLLFFLHVLFLRHQNKEKLISIVLIKKKIPGTKSWPCQDSLCLGRAFISWCVCQQFINYHLPMNKGSFNTATFNSGGALNYLSIISKSTKPITTNVVSKYFQLYYCDYDAAYS